MDDMHNYHLSIQRADAVHRAVLDAMKLYQRHRWAKVSSVEGFGERKAREKSLQGGNLKDPPSTRNSADFIAWIKLNRGQVAKWPVWRRVDVLLNGVELLRFYD